MPYQQISKLNPQLSKLKFCVLIRAVMQHFFFNGEFFEKIVEVPFDFHIVLVHLEPKFGIFCQLLV